MKTRTAFSETVRRLDQVRGGERAIVREVTPLDGDLQRLMAMGVCRGRRVEVIQQGNPLIIGVLGARIGVSARLASRIMVQPCVESRTAAPASLAAEPVLA
jgi:Fe2+ transport system protein FeoA